MGGPNLAADPYGTDPTTASIGFANGHAAGSASPLTWAQAGLLRLVADLHTGITDRPDITYNRYVRNGAPGTVPVTISSPANNTSVPSTTTVTGTTTPGATVTASVVANNVTGANTVRETTADSSGNYSVDVPIAFGDDVITVAATTATGTGTAQVTVQGDLVGGTTVLDTADPANDDNGPGTYQYPTSSNFTAGSFDITRFQVLTKDGTVYLRTTLRNLTPTFGQTIGAQLFDIYVHTPGAASTSTAAAFAQRNYTIAPADAWSQRIEIQGFASPVWVDANGNQQGTASGVVASTGSKTVTIALPEAQFGTPTTGWSFVETLTGQAPEPDQARTFAPTPQEYQFGVCAAGGTSPICAVDPSSVPKVMDTLTPPGVSQADELDPTQPPVVLQGVAVP